MTGSYFISCWDMLAGTRVFFLIVAFFVCPLLFFTNLTRNPYVTQISLLNISILAAAALYFINQARSLEPRLARTPLDIPLMAWCGACLLSWAVAFIGHNSFYRDSIINEGARNMIFLGVNAVFPFYLAVICWGESDKNTEVNLPLWAGFILIWGILWTAYPQLRGPNAAPTDIGGLLWDGYGGFLWIAGIAGAFWLCRRGRAVDFLHLGMAAGMLASVYGVLQYFNVEMIWPHALNPYGGRSVSTFGNPNFMSSFNIVLLPFAVVHFIKSKGVNRIIYGILTLFLEAAVLCSMTRSSWGGAVLALSLLALSPDLRKRVSQDPRPNGLLFSAAIALFLLWPQSSIVTGYTPSTIGRLSELVQVANADRNYGPWYQRLLIWSCAWLMGNENPLTGKGWGLFELFYPFYQGPMLNAFEHLRSMRTHANNAHNEILEIWSQTGLIGLGVFAWLWTAFAAAVRARFKGDLEREGVFVAAAAGVAGMLADNLLNVSLHFAVPAFIFWWAAGTAVAPGYRPRNIGKSAAVKWGLIAAAAITMSLSWYWVKAWNREVRYFAGFKLLRQGAMPAAVKQLELSRAWGPAEVNSIYELANAYARNERFTEAAKTYKEALAANAGYDEIYFNLGVIESARLNNVEAAIAYFRMAWWINPLSTEIYNSLAGLYLRQPERYGEQALELLAAAVKIYPRNPNHWNNLGYLYSLRREYSRAEQAYTRALTLEPGLRVAEQNLAAVSRQAGRAKPAILSALEELRELEARVARKDYSESTLSLAGRVSGRFPDLAQARFIWGSLLLTRGHPEQAQRELAAVAAGQPRHLGARVNLAQAYLALGRRAEAAAEFSAALGIDPGNARAAQALKELSGLK